MGEGFYFVKSFLIEQASRVLHRLLSTEPAAPPNASESHRILVVKPASLGDVLMSTAFLAALRANLPHADITVLVTTWAKEALAGNSHCDHVLDSGSVGFPGHYGFSAFRDCVSRVRERRFTHCFVLDRSPLMALLPRLAGIPWRAGLNSAHRGIALHIRVPCPDDRHEVETYLDVLRKAGLDVTRPHLHFCPQSTDSSEAESLLIDKGLANGRPIIALHPGGGKNPGTENIGKRWSRSNFATLAEGLAGSLDANILLVGGPDDVPAADSVQSSASVPVVSVTGKLTFAQLGALIQRCHLFVGNDSAPMHLAAAVGTPVVALFGPTSPQRYGPYGVQSRVVCFAPNQGEEKVTDEVEAVLSAARRLLSSSPDNDPVHA